MAENVYMAFKCLNPECGKAIHLPRPEKTGVYAITCPHCGVKKALKLMGCDSLPTEPAPEDKTEAPDNSGKEPLEMNDYFVVGQQYSFKCPHCQEMQISFSTNKPGKRTVNCPHCRGPIKFEVCQKTEKIILTDTLQMYRGKLTLLRKGWLNKEFRLPAGKHVIGRYDEDEPSDISIKNDDSISRRSIVIDVEHTVKGYTFKLTVLKATNPVLHNDTPLLPGEAVSLNFGDSIVMGKTRFRFDKDTKTPI